jgi:MSHA biogenesis protein MshI
VLSLLQKVLSRSARRSAGHAGVVLGEDSFALVLVRRDGGGKPSIDHCRVHPSRGSLAATLRSRLDKLGASRAATCAVVDAEDYQVVQVEAPEVLPSEMRAAIRWRLRDAISFKVDDAAVDVFEIPESARRTQTRMLFAVAARSAAIERLTSTLQSAAKGFYAIDIPELCLRNISALLPQDDKGVAMLALNESYAQLVTTRQGVMYLTRRIDTARRFEPHAQERGETDLDVGALALELQRSLDYYESHYDQTPIGDLVIAPGGERAQRVAAALRNESSLRVHVLDVRELCNVHKSGELVTDWPSLMALGAALRTESAK